MEQILCETFNISLAAIPMLYLSKLGTKLQFNNYLQHVCFNLENTIFTKLAITEGFYYELYTIFVQVSLHLF